MIAWPSALVREIADRRVLVFVGAGISRAARPSMPSWSSLISDLSDLLPKKVDKALVRSMVSKGSLLDAAQIISDGIDRADLNAKLKDIFQVRPLINNEIYKHILSLDLKTIVTTNYDEFLEKNFEHYSGGAEAYSICKHTSNDLLNNIRSPSRTIVKMHGCITEPSNLVLDRYSYFKARQKNSGFYSVITSLFTVNTVLFLGYSMGDPDMQIILENIHSSSDSEHGHYTLVPKQEHRSLVKATKQTYNISSIEYPKNEMSQISSHLESLASRVRDLRAARGIV